MLRFSFLLVSVVLLCSVTSAQMTRDAMDEKRMFTELEGDKAYETSLEFLRSDSSYYLGWLYLGASLHKRAADLIGYQKCILPLLRAKSTIEKDFGKVLKTRTPSEDVFFSNFYRYQDYNYITYFLTSAYSILAKEDSSYWAAQAYQNFDFQKDLAYFNGPFISKAWTVYRNRNLTSADFRFLKKDLNENMKYVHALLDSAQKRIEENIALNNKALGYMDNSNDYGALYHLQSIVYSYEKDYEKAEEAHTKMEELGMFSYNNYGLLKLCEGDFEQAYTFFDFNRKIVPYHKSLEEWIYYEGILNTYRHQNKESIKNITDWILTVGSTPGYGWYNLGLARSLLYNGDIEGARQAWTKAKNFTEYHIGTTLGAESYRQTLEFLDVLMLDYELEGLKFENPSWFLSLKQISRYARLRWKLLIKRWTILNDVAGFQDREKLIYDMFSGESTLGWYDIFHTLKRFSVNYFEDYYTKLLADENTPLGLRPYYRYALAALYEEAGRKSKARQQINILDEQSMEEQEFDRLLNYFLMDLKIDLGMIDKSSGINEMYRLYPELLPYTGHRMKFQLEVVGETDELLESCIERMRECRLAFQEEAEGKVPKVTISGIVSEDQHYVNVNVTLEGKKLMDTYKMSVSEAEDGIKMAYAIFNIYNLNQDGQQP